MFVISVLVWFINQLITVAAPPCKNMYAPHPPVTTNETMGVDPMCGGFQVGDGSDLFQEIWTDPLLIYDVYHTYV